MAASGVAPRFAPSVWQLTVDASLHESHCSRLGQLALIGAIAVLVGRTAAALIAQIAGHLTWWGYPK